MPEAPASSLLSAERFPLSGHCAERKDREDIRWYLEDYLQHHADPPPIIARRIEGPMRDIGVQLFPEAVQSSDDARDLWSNLRPRLDQTRLEIITEVREATAIPWKLLRDPNTDSPLAPGETPVYLLRK